MKKFSSLIIVFICLISLVLVGCSYADNATLISITEKYNYISSKYDEIFAGSRFMPSYKSDNLNYMINSEDINYNILKTDNSFEIYDARGEYGILMEGVNSTYLNSNASSVLANNEVTEKKYKKNMYISLENLQKNVKKLDTSKTSLESVYNNDQRNAQIVSEQELTKYNLNKYINNLNACLKNLYQFNKNYNLALNNNIIKPINLEELLYETNMSTSVSNEYITMLINNANLMISNYVLNYSIDLKANILDSTDLLNAMAEIMNEKSRLNSSDKLNALESYKIIRTMEDAIRKNETSFNNACKVLNKNSFANPSENESLAINNIQTYRNELFNYVSDLIEFLKNLT